MTNDPISGQTPDFSALRSPVPETAPSTQKRSLRRTLREVWRGERSLAETWWIWNVLIGKLGIGIGLILPAAVLFQATKIWLPFAVILIVYFSYTVWIWVGCFRCAWARRGFWGWVVIILCILGVLQTLVSLSRLRVH
jgi:hypothetical protein